MFGQKQKKIFELRIKRILLQFIGEFTCIELFLLFFHISVICIITCETDPLQLLIISLGNDHSEYLFVFSEIYFPLLFLVRSIYLRNI